MVVLWSCDFLLLGFWFFSCTTRIKGARIFKLTIIKLQQSTLEYSALEELNPCNIRHFSLLILGKIRRGIIGPNDMIDIWIYNIVWLRFQFLNSVQKSISSILSTIFEKFLKFGSVLSYFLKTLSEAHLFIFIQSVTRCGFGVR